MPPHVLRAYLENPTLHKRLSSRGGINSARVKTKTPTQTKALNPLVQGELALGVTQPVRSASSTPIAPITPAENDAMVAEVFRKVREELNKIGSFNVNQNQGLYDYYIRNKQKNDQVAARQDESFLRRAILRNPEDLHTLADTDIKTLRSILKEMRNPENQTKYKINKSLWGAAAGGGLGALGAMLLKRPELVAALGLGGAAAGGGLAYMQAQKQQKQNMDNSEAELLKNIKARLNALKKQEEQTPTVIKDIGKAQYIAAGAALPSVFTNAAALGAMHLANAHAPELTDSQMAELVENAGLKNPKNLKVTKPTSTTNHWSDYLRANAYYDPSRHEISATHNLTWKPGIMAHELGHAKLQETPGLVGALQRHVYTPTALMQNLFGGLASNMGAYYLTKNEDDPTRGALKGFGVGAVTNAGILVPEFEASRLGVANLLKSKQLTSGQKLKSSLALAPAFLTYLGLTAGAPALVGGVNAYWNKKKKEKSLKKQAKSLDLIRLIEAKKKSDQRDYVAKNQLLLELVNRKPKDFKIDSYLNKDYVGLTHIPTGFKIHAPKKILPGSIFLTETSN